MPGIINGMTFNVAAGFLQFDSEGFMKAQKIAMIRAMKNAAKLWLTTAISRIPRDSGFLHSGFMNLAAFLGVRINEKGQVKRGRDLHGQEERLANLQKRYKALKSKALANGHVEERFEGKKRKIKTKYPKQKSYKKRREESRKYLHNKEKHQAAKAQSKRTTEQIGHLKDEGLSIHTHINTDEKKSGRVYKGEKNTEYYEEQRQRRDAARAIKRLRKLQHRIREQKSKVERAAENAPELKTKKRSGNNYYTEIEKTVYETHEVEIVNPAYPTNPRQLLDMKRKGTLPPKTIKVMKQVPTIIKKRVRKKNPVGPNFINIYRHYYYPRNGQRGPLKTPLGGIKYGTPPDEIVKLNDSKIPPASISTETSTINKKGEEVAGNELLKTLDGQAFTPTSSLNLSKNRLQSNAKVFLTFNYKVDIRYLRIMDIFKPRRRDGRTYSGAPWNSIGTANKAFMNILKQEYAKLAPSFISYVVVARGTLKTPGFKGGL